MTAQHVARERDLLSGIHEKNSLVCRMQRLNSGIRRWTERLRTRRSRRWQAQLRQSIERYSRELKTLQQEVLQRSRRLKERIEKELRISPDEVRQFQEQLRREVDEAVQAQKRLDEARQALAEAEATPEDKLAKTPQEAMQILQNLRRSYRRAQSQASSESKDVTRVKKEIASEAADRPVLEHELRRAVQEIEALTARP
jgi:chromosome segregation ATPase